MIAMPDCTPRIDAFETILPDEQAARAQFAATRALVWPGALGGSLLERLIAVCDRAAFVSETVEGLGHREIERPPVAGTAVVLALRRASLFRWLERVTDCKRIASVEGRVVQTRPRAGDELIWHDDLGGDLPRRLGITIALGRAAFEGGAFEMRRFPGREPLLTWKHDRLGAALIFDVSRHCEHRVLPLVAGGPRRVFTGWFMG